MPEDMKEYIESGFLFTFPAATSFRFCDMPPYQKLSGNNLKEMDFGWWDEQTKSIHLLEVKDERILRKFIHQMGTKKKVKKYKLTTDFELKIMHSLAILSAVWSGTSKGQDFKRNLPAVIYQYPGEDSIVISVLIDSSHKRKTNLSPVLDRMKKIVIRKLKGCLRLFGVKGVKFYDLQRARYAGIMVNRLPV